jgi:hypothetical protein
VLFFCPGVGCCCHRPLDCWFLVLLLLLAHTQSPQGRLLAYAGVGVVAASEVTAEWQELCLKVSHGGSKACGFLGLGFGLANRVQKLVSCQQSVSFEQSIDLTLATTAATAVVVQVRQFEGMLSPLLSPPLPSLPNAQMAWAAVAVEELTRLGVSTFAVAPGEAVGGVLSCLLLLPVPSTAAVRRQPPNSSRPTAAVTQWSRQCLPILQILL